MSEAKLREDICRFGRSLFERGLTPGLIRQHQRAARPTADWLVTPTNASLGFLDPGAHLAPRTRTAALISGDAPTKEIPLHAALYETRSRRAGDRPSAFDAFGRGVDAARRSIRTPCCRR